MNTKYFCSHSSRQSKDSIAGTASYFKHLLLLEYRGAFKKKAFEESEIPQSVKSTIIDFIKTMPNTKLLLIKKGNTANTKKLSLYGGSKNFAYNHIEINRYQDISLEILNDLFKGENSEKTNMKPIFLVCTNGTKDKCCAKFGLPIWKTFNDINDNVWQCSHLGGDRFAPTALVLPSFSIYGHILGEDVSSIVSYENEEKLYLKKLRGRALYNFYEQAADIYIRKDKNIENINSIQIISSRKITDNMFNVCLKIKQSNKEIQLKVEKKRNGHFDYMTCSAKKKSYSFEYIVEYYPSKTKSHK